MHPAGCLPFFYGAGVLPGPFELFTGFAIAPENGTKKMLQITFIYKNQPFCPSIEQLTRMWRTELEHKPLRSYRHRTTVWHLPRPQDAAFPS